MGDHIIRRGICGLLLALAAAAIAGCKPTNQIVAKLPPFIVTNDVVGGKSREVIKMANGISLYFTVTDVVLWFQTNSSIVIELDPQTHRPKTTLFETPSLEGGPSQEFMDINADGIPDIRKFSGTQKTDLLFKGEWFPRLKEGANTFITLDGRKALVHFDGSRWRLAETNEANSL